MPRAIWKGFLQVAAISCPVALHAAASTAERVSFHMVNRKTGNRVRREFVDAETGKPVAREDQVKGYEVTQGRFVELTETEIAATVPESDKRLVVERFVPCDKVDTVFFDRPYYIAPAGDEAVFALIRAGLEAESVAALARAVLFRRVRTMLIRAQGEGLVGATLNFADEVRPAEEVFGEVGEVALQDEMVDLARHIIGTKEGAFDPAGFDDRYDAALAELVKAKMEGRTLPKPKPPKVRKGDDLLAALRESAGVGAKGGPKGGARAKAGGKQADATPAARKRKAS